MRFAELSPREAEVATLVADDLSDKEIAMVMRISPRTVHEYLDRIGRKLRCDHSRRARRRVIRVWVQQRDRLLTFDPAQRIA